MVLSNLLEFAETSQEAAKINKFYEKGYITHEEAEKMMLQAYEDSKYYWIVKCKGGRKKWMSYSGLLSKIDAEKLANDCNMKQIYDINDHVIKFKAFSISKSGVLFDMKRYFDTAYKHFYDNAGTERVDEKVRKLSALFDNFQEYGVLADFAKYRQDTIASDREAAAFMVAYCKLIA